MPEIVRRFQLLSGLCVLAFATCSHAQTIALRLVNGKTGRPLTNKNLHVTFWWDDPSRPYKDKRVPVDMPWSGKEVYIDKTGVAHIDVPPNAAMVEVEAGLKIGKEPGRVPYIVCNPPNLPQIPLTEILNKGFVPENACSNRLKVSAKPGEYVYFATPLPRWMPDMQ